MVCQWWDRIGGDSWRICCPRRCFCGRVSSYPPRIDYSHSHKGRVSLCPCHCLSFAFEEPVNDERSLLGCATARASGGLAANDRRSGVDCQAGRIWKQDRAAVRYFARVHRAVASAQPGASAGTRAGTVTSPVNGDPGKERLIVRRHGRRNAQGQSRCYKK